MVAVAESELTPAPARTSPIGPALHILGCGQCHYFGRRTAPLQQLDHRLHRGTRMGEEQIQAGTQVVLTGIAIARESESILGTATVAQTLHLATLALRSKQIALVVSELALLGGR